MAFLDKTGLERLWAHIVSRLGSKADKTELPQIVAAESSDGVAFTATVPGITELTNGISFIMIPSTKSTSTTPTLNVNGLGEKSIKRRQSGLYTSLQPGYSAGWLAANIPFRLIYDATSRSSSDNTGVWIVEGYDKPAANDLYGTLSIEKGGTGATTVADALTNLGINGIGLEYTVANVSTNTNENGTIGNRMLNNSYLENFITSGSTQPAKHLVAIIPNADIIFDGTILYGPYLSQYYYYNGTNWVASSSLTGCRFPKGQALFVYFESSAAYKFDKAYILNPPVSDEMETTWQNGTVGSISGLLPQYKKNGNLITVRFNTDPNTIYSNPNIPTGSLLGELPSDCYVGSYDQYAGNTFLVSGNSGSSIYRVRIEENCIYYTDCLVGTDWFKEDVFHFQFTYSI